MPHKRTQLLLSLLQYQKNVRTDKWVKIGHILGIIDDSLTKTFAVYNVQLVLVISSLIHMRLWPL